MVGLVSGGGGALVGLVCGGAGSVVGLVSGGAGALVGLVALEGVLVGGSETGGSYVNTCIFYMWR